MATKHEEFARTLAEQGKEQMQIERALIRAGMDELPAQNLARREYQNAEEIRRATGRGGSSNVGLIVVLCLIGAGVFFAIMATGEVNPRYAIKFVIGVVVIGGFRLVRGLS